MKSVLVYGGKCARAALEFWQVLKGHITVGGVSVCQCMVVGGQGLCLWVYEGCAGVWQ